MFSLLLVDEVSVFLKVLTEISDYFLFRRKTISVSGRLELLASIYIDQSVFTVVSV